MPHSRRSPKLENRTARLKLAIRKKPYSAIVAPGVMLLYRRNQGIGKWSVRLTGTSGGKRFDRVSKIGVADDHSDADGRDVLDYWQAQEEARSKGRRGDLAGGPKTIAQALTDYADDLKTRGGDVANVTRARRSLGPEMLDRDMWTVSSAEWKRWRNSLTKLVAPATVNRTITCVKAALNLAAGDEERTAHCPWKAGLKAIPGSEESRNVILSDSLANEIVEGAREPSWNLDYCPANNREKAQADAQKWANALGLFIEVLAVTGARPIQAAQETRGS